MTSPQSSVKALFIAFFSVIFTLAGATLSLSLPAQAVTQNLVCSPARIYFGAVALEQSEAQPVVVTNTGQTSITISSISASGSEFSISGIKLPVTLASGQSAGLNVTFAPTGRGWTDAKVTFTSDTTNAQFSLQVQGTGVKSAPLSAQPASLSFGQVAVGSSATLPVVVTNSHAYDETVTAYPVEGSAFSVSGPSLPAVLGAGQSITLNVRFKPQSLGITSGSVFAYGPGLNIPVSGTGTSTGGLSISPTALSFGTVNVGSTGVQPLTLSAGSTAITISAIGSNNSQFGLAGLTLPLTINAGQNFTLDVTFSPASSGSATGALTFTTSTSQTHSVENLSGTGAAPQYSVNLSWSPSASSVVGYNVYRGTVAGSYSKINSALDAATTYSDNTVVSGTTYYYTATSVNSSGQESGYSTPLKVVVQ